MPQQGSPFSDKPAGAPGENRRNGFSLIESLIGLALSLLITLAALETYGAARDHSSDIRLTHEIREAVTTAGMRIRLDLMEAGRGLTEAAAVPLLDCVELDGDRLQISSLDRVLHAASDLVAGQTFIPIDHMPSIGRGRRICILENGRGEAADIRSTAAGGLIISPALQNPYIKEKCRILLLRSITYFLDESSEILRRRVNSSPAQPLMENAGRFSVERDPPGRLIRVSLSHTMQKEQSHETIAVPKNLALAEIR